MFGESISHRESEGEAIPAINRRKYLKLAGVAGTGVGTGVGASTLGTEFTTPARAATTVVDDFSDTNLGGRYVFDTQNATTSVATVSNPVTSDADTNVLQMQGDGNTQMYAFEGDGDTDLGAYPEIGDTFSCWLRGLDGAENMNVYYGAQDMDNKYYVKLNLAEGHLGLFAYDGGSGMTFTGDWNNSAIQNTTGWYELEIDWTTEHEHTVTLYQNGSEVTSFSYTESSSEPQHTATGVGFAGYLSSGETAQFDYATTSGNDQSSPSTFVVDNFENGNLSEYTHDTSRNGRGDIVSGPTYMGSNVLELHDESTEIISVSGLDAYPSAGDTFSYWVRASNGADNLNVTWAVQDHENRYYAKLKPDVGDLYIFTLKDGGGNYKDGVSGLSLSQDAWYELEIDWATDGSQVATLYDSNGIHLAQVSMTDSTWSSGGIGYDAYPSSGESVYFDYVTFPEATQLGSFENGLDGWTATGSNSLSRVDGFQQPAAVTEGNHALDVTVNSDSEPSIENQQLVQNADFENNPCLLADVLPSAVENSSSAVTFRFRYHHSDPGGVEESPEHTVGQQYGGRICWDMSGLSATKLSNPDRLEIVWYPGDHPPSSGFDYNGVVYVDNVHLSNNQDRVALTRCGRKRHELERAHGLRVDTIVQSESDTVQDGVFEYEDGTQISYRAELLSDGERKLEIDGEAFHFKEGFQ